MKLFFNRLWNAIKSFWLVIIGQYVSFEHEIAHATRDLEYLSEQHAKEQIAQIAEILNRFDYRADLTWKELHTAYVDIVCECAKGMSANIATISHAATSAVNNATGPLNDRIFKLETKLKELGNDCVL